MVFGNWINIFQTIIPPICVSVTPLQALALDYGIAFYPLLLATVTYILVSMYSWDVRVIVWLWKPNGSPNGLKLTRGFLAVIVSRTQTLKEGMANFTVQSCVDCATNIVAL